MDWGVFFRELFSDTTFLICLGALIGGIWGWIIARKRRKVFLAKYDGSLAVQSAALTEMQKTNALLTEISQKLGSRA